MSFIKRWKTGYKALKHNYRNEIGGNNTANEWETKYPTNAATSVLHIAVSLRDSST